MKVYVIYTLIEGKDWVLPHIVGVFEDYEKAKEITNTKIHLTHNMHWFEEFKLNELI